MNIGIIGMGRAGMNMARLIKSNGHQVLLSDVAASEQALQLADREALIVLEQSQLTARSDWLVLAVPDDQIVALVNSLQTVDRLQAIAHLSGATPLTVFDSLPQRIERFCLHPMRAFANVDQPLELFDTCYFGFTGSDSCFESCKSKLPRIAERLLQIADTDKARYHLAAVQASNFMMYQLQTAENGYLSVNIEPQIARRIVHSLAQTALDNYLANGAVNGLTGPVARGDLGTVKQHAATLTGSALADYHYQVEQTLALVADRLPRAVYQAFRAYLAEERYETTI